MPTLPGVLAPVWVAVALLLLSSCHANRLYSADDISVILNIAINIADGSKVDATLLLRAFANEAANSFALEYNSYFGNTDRDDIVYVRIGTRPGRRDAANRKSLHIGRFLSMEEARQASVVRWNTGIADGARTSLVACLEGICKRRAAKQKRATTNISPDEGRDDAADGRPPLIVQGAILRDTQPAESTLLHYILDGRAGKMEATSNGIFILRKLRNNLLPANGNEYVVAKNYVPASHGSSQCWIPAGSTAYPSNHLSRLKRQAKITANWEALFDGGKCLFSQRFLRTISQFALHNMRGSDKGTEMLIAGTIKGLAEEVGLGIPSVSLARGCPSRRTLARGEKRLSADCLVSVVEDIKRDNAKWVALMVDHGKRSGIEHFVKMLCWAGLDEQGNAVVKYFCLDINRSNHAAKDCAAAIKMSINKLEIAGLYGCTHIG